MKGGWEPYREFVVRVFFSHCFPLALYGLEEVKKKRNERTNEYSQLLFCERQAVYSVGSLLRSHPVSIRIIRSISVVW